VKILVCGSAAGITRSSPLYDVDRGELGVSKEFRGFFEIFYKGTGCAARRELHANIAFELVIRCDARHKRVPTLGCRESPRVPIPSEVLTGAHVDLRGEQHAQLAEIGSSQRHRERVTSHSTSDVT
jgi:hypothetical protein